MGYSGTSKHLIMASRTTQCACVMFQSCTSCICFWNDPFHRLVLAWENAAAVNKISGWIKHIHQRCYWFRLCLCVWHVWRSAAEKWKCREWRCSCFFFSFLKSAFWEAPSAMKTIWAFTDDIFPQQKKKKNLRRKLNWVQSGSGSRYCSCCLTVTWITGTTVISDLYCYW